MHHFPPSGVEPFWAAVQRVRAFVGLELVHPAVDRQGAAGFPVRVPTDDGTEVALRSLVVVGDLRMPRTTDDSSAVPDVDQEGARDRTAAPRSISSKVSPALLRGDEGGVVHRGLSQPTDLPKTQPGGAGREGSQRSGRVEAVLVFDGSGQVHDRPGRGAVGLFELGVGETHWF